MSKRSIPNPKYDDRDRPWKTRAVAVQGLLDRMGTDVPRITYDEIRAAAPVEWRDELTDGVLDTILNSLGIEVEG